MVFQRNIGEVESQGYLAHHYGSFLQSLKRIINAINSDISIWFGRVEAGVLREVMALDDAKPELAHQPLNPSAWIRLFRQVKPSPSAPVIFPITAYPRCFADRWHEGFMLAVPLETAQTGWFAFLYHRERMPLAKMKPSIAFWPWLWQAGCQANMVTQGIPKASRDSFKNAAAWLQRCRSPNMSRMVNLAKRVAKSETAILVTGETGTGKGVLAKALHAWSRRSKRSFTSVNCATLKPELVESELFGHVRGAFTGAEKDREGRFQIAHGGTLFLDEIGELPLELQTKLLRVLQEGEFEPLGSNQTLRVDVRVIAATNQDLKTAVREGHFREDLYFRLAVFPIHIPPLRDRLEDIPAIADALLEHWLQQGIFDWKPTLSDVDWRRLHAENWPGNIRQLSHFLKRSMVMADGPTAWTLQYVPVDDGERATTPAVDMIFPTLEQAEKAHIAHALQTTGGRLYGPRGAAKLLGLHPSTLRGRMRKLGMGGAKQFKS